MFISNTDSSAGVMVTGVAMIWEEVDCSKTVELRVDEAMI